MNTKEAAANYQQQQQQSVANSFNILIASR
jgi:hypothetical protein